MRLFSVNTVVTKSTYCSILSRCQSYPKAGCLAAEQQLWFQLSHGHDALLHATFTEAIELTDIDIADFTTANRATVAYPVVTDHALW